MYIVLADDHTIVLDGLELLLSTFGFVNKVAKAMNEDELQQHIEQQKPDLILLDIMFGKTDGKELCKKIKKQYSEIKIIALTSYSDISTVKTAILAGFDGYLLKSEDRQTMMDAIQSVHQGAQYFSPQVKNVFFEQSISKTKPTLTKREEEILKLIVEEKTTKEIAEELFISEKTVENHRTNLMLKLDVRNVAGLVKKAITMNLI
ncbi:MAG: response regulator transcription factor [Chitinophagaceae bacterium]|nr:response regulator transcription factor [Chitinophagaceae bacterium]MCZ2396461.1 response regulator transcription factor [Chitinophagales bacterium]